MHIRNSKKAGSSSLAGHSCRRSLPVCVETGVFPRGSGLGVEEGGKGLWEEGFCTHVVVGSLIEWDTK